MVKLSLEESADIILEQVEDCIVVGYWKLDDGYAFAIRDLNGIDTRCTTYLIDSNGNVTPTNPVVSHLHVQDFKLYVRKA